MTLAELKRKLQVGSKLQIVHHSYASQVPVERRESFFGVREVIKVQSNAIVLSSSRDDKKGSWLTWPKVNQIRFQDDGFEICLDEDGSFKHSMRYEYR